MRELVPGRSHPDGGLRGTKVLVGGIEDLWQIFGDIESLFYSQVKKVLYRFNAQKSRPMFFRYRDYSEKDLYSRIYSYQLGSIGSKR